MSHEPCLMNQSNPSVIPFAGCCGSCRRGFSDSVTRCHRCKKRCNDCQNWLYWRFAFLRTGPGKDQKAFAAGCTKHMEDMKDDKLWQTWAAQWETWMEKTEAAKTTGKRVAPFDRTVTIASKKRRYHQRCEGIFWPLDTFRAHHREPEEHEIVMESCMDDSDQEEEGVIMPEIVGEPIFPGCRRIFTESGTDLTSTKTLADTKNMSKEHVDDVYKAASSRFATQGKRSAPTVQRNEDNELVPVITAEEHEAQQKALAKKIADGTQCSFLCRVACFDFLYLFRILNVLFGCQSKR